MRDLLLFVLVLAAMGSCSALERIAGKIEPWPRIQKETAPVDEGCGIGCKLLGR